MPAGRPTIYNDALAKEICKRLSEGESLRSICNGPPRFDPMVDEDRHSHMPDVSTVLDWALDPQHEFSPQYDKAREKQMEFYADQIVSIADTYREVPRGRLKVDSLKWVMSRLSPRRFGDHIRAELTGKDGKDLDNNSTQQLASLFAAALNRRDKTQDDEDDLV